MPKNNRAPSIKRHGQTDNWTLQSAIEAYAQAEALFNSIGDGAIATDEHGRITRVNAAGLKIFDCKEENLLDKWLPKTIRAYNENGDQIPLMDRPITRAFLTGKSITEKIFFEYKKGESIPMSCTVSPLIQSGRPIGAIMLFRDISQEYEIDRMKSDFISLASHQLRTPLSAIKTYSHMLADGMVGPISGTQKRTLKTIILATNRMNRLITTLLNVSRIESGNVVVNPKKVNLNHIVQEVFKEMRFSDRYKNIDFKSRHTTNPVIIVSDNLVVKEIVNNLVSNAAKYSSKYPIVKVKIARQSKQKVLITVEDNGIGIPVSDRGNLFSKFYRAKNVTRQDVSGTGLGLYLVKGLVETLGGRIWFDSELGKCTSFYVELPAKYQRAKPRNGLNVAI